MTKVFLRRIHALVHKSRGINSYKSTLFNKRATQILDTAKPKIIKKTLDTLHCWQVYGWESLHQKCERKQSTSCTHYFNL